MNETNKIGRNDACPCGSGKKYKQCCLKAPEAVAPEDHLWHSMRRVTEGLPAELLKFATAQFGRAALTEAWNEFMPWDDEPFTPDTPHMPVFMPWFLYDWSPYLDPATVTPDGPEGLTVAEAYLRQKGARLDPLLVRYIEQCCAAHFSFHDVVSCRPGRGFLLRDILTGEQVDVTERSASRSAKSGDILFAKVVRVDHVAVLEACASVMFPPLEKASILELRKRIKPGKQPLTAALLKEYDLDLFDIYHDIVDRLLNPQLPVLQNTDGDPIISNRLIYEIESPDEVFNALKHLCLTAGRDELLAGAKLDAAGELHKIEFTWEKAGNEKHKSWDNTILGHLRIEGRRLTAEVNSENRAMKFRTLMEELLPGKARYKTTVIESPQAMLAQALKEGQLPDAGKREQEVEDLNALPEVRTQLAEAMRAHYRHWLHEKLPILGGKTPLQAVRSKDGREMVEALLVQIERSAHIGNPPLDESIVRELRDRLGLG